MAASELYPLSFVGIFKERIWGGRRLAPILNKDLPISGPVGESWELVDLQGDQSVVASGSLAGTPLSDLIQRFGPALMGPVELDGGRFPLLVKYIDASQVLSIQVHPDAEVAADLRGRPKSEAWYILDAEPGAVIYLGLKPGSTAEQFRAAIEQGTVEDLVVACPVQPGQLFPVPPGTVHAIGAGILLAEVQQPSDTTYRVYDWGRVGLDGNPRQLHVDQAMQSIHFGQDPIEPETGDGLVDMKLFQILCMTLGSGTEVDLDGEGPAVVVGLEGEALLIHDHGDPVRCARGEVILVPHVCRRARLSSRATSRVMRVTFPAG
jgi:mannose-6-phosphate isomerase